jgi:hypothetical protein
VWYNIITIKKGIDIMKNYYTTPTQVKFTQLPELDLWIGGIAFQNSVICGCCGGVFPLSSIEGIEEMPWIDINEEIKGE